MSELVMRSIYLRPQDDALLRQLAHEFEVTRSDLIRAAISVKLKEWLAASGDKQIVEDLEVASRDLKEVGRGV